jgi:hypothetical protein
MICSDCNKEITVQITLNVEEVKDLKPYIDTHHLAAEATLGKVAPFPEKMTYGKINYPIHICLPCLKRRIDKET